MRKTLIAVIAALALVGFSGCSDESDADPAAAGTSESASQTPSEAPNEEESSAAEEPTQEPATKESADDSADSGDVGGMTIDSPSFKKSFIEGLVNTGAISRKQAECFHSTALERGFTMKDLTNTKKVEKLRDICM